MAVQGQLAIRRERAQGVAETDKQNVLAFWSISSLSHEMGKISNALTKLILNKWLMMSGPCWLVPETKGQKIGMKEHRNIEGSITTDIITEALWFAMKEIHFYQLDGKHVKGKKRQFKGLSIWIFQSKGNGHHLKITADKEYTVPLSLPRISIKK